MPNLLPTQYTVRQLVELFASGEIAIPEIQRDVVWKPDQVKELIDSINLGYPCGSLIFWEPREKDAQLVRSMIRPERLKRQAGKLPRYFLLDGQQRLTALASVFLSRDDLRDLLAELSEDMPYIVVNVKRFPNEIEASTDPMINKFPWVMLNRLLDGTIQNDPNFQGLAQDLRERLSRYGQRVRDYVFPVQIIQEQDYSAVAEIFRRVNSLGTQLTGAEIQLARIVPHWKGITKDFREYRQQLQSQRYDLDLTFLMRAVTVVECKVAQPKKLAERIAKDRPSHAHLGKTWKKARGAIDKVIKTLQSGLQLDKSKYFTSKNSLIPLVYYFAMDSRPALRAAQRFFLLSQLSGHYSAAGETALRKDFRALTDPSVTIRRGLECLVKIVEQEAKRDYRGLRLLPRDVYGGTSRNILLLLMYILMRRKGATDWGSENILPLSELEPKNTQLHHIFPFNFMMTDKGAEECRDREDMSASEFRAEVNDIANITFLSQFRNVAIADMPPWQYLPTETTKQMRKAHFIPEDPELWKPTNFLDFLDARRALLAKAMTALLKSVK